MKIEIVNSPATCSLSKPPNNPTLFAYTIILILHSSPPMDRSSKCLLSTNMLSSISTNYINIIINIIQNIHFFNSTINRIYLIFNISINSMTKLTLFSYSHSIYQSISNVLQKISKTPALLSKNQIGIFIQIKIINIFLRKILLKPK